MKKLLKNRSVQIGLAALIGCAIGALFYPTKHIEERVKQEYEQKLEVERVSKEELEKVLKEEIDELKEERTTLKIETSERITQLKYEIKDLQAKKKETFYKLVKPDGTVEIRKFKESEVNESTRVITSIRQEFDQKVSEIEERWKRVHTKRVETLKQEFDVKEKQYQETIAKMESEKEIHINPKKYGIEVGILSNKNYYTHANVDVFGPVFVGVHSQTDFIGDFAIGAGVGLRF